MIKRIVGFYYSPAGGARLLTETLARDLAAILDDCIPEEVLFESHDLASKHGKDIALNEENIAIVGVPAYIGKIPLPAAEAISRIKGKDILTITAVSYGGRSCGNALYELQRCAEEAGLKVIGAGSFVVGRGVLKGRAKTGITIDVATLDEFETAVSSKIKRLAGCEVEGLKIKPAPVETPGRMPVHFISRFSPKAAATAQAFMERICIMRRRSEWYL